MAVTQLLEPLMDTLEGIRMPTGFIHLDRMPRDEEGVAELHQALQKCQDGPLADGWGEVSHWSAERMEWECASDSPYTRRSMWCLAVSRTKTDPRQAFRSLLKDYPNIRQDVCKQFNGWSRMVDRAARASRPARTLE